jgi:hypothetical protein
MRHHWFAILCALLFLQSFGGGGDPGSFLSGVPIIGSLLSGLFGLFGGGLEDAVKKFADWTVRAASFLASAVKNVIEFFKKLAGSVANILGHIWTGFFKKIFTALLHGIQDVHKFLEAKLRPIIDYLKKIRAFYDRWYKQYMRPILNMMQNIRKGLQILKLFHVKFAQDLDKRIAGIEAQLTNTFLTVRGIFNSLIDFTNAIADPLRLLRHPTVVLSLRRAFNGSLRLFTGRPPGYFFPSPRARAGPGLGPVAHGFLASDPGDNPPASSYLQGDDGLGTFDGFAPGVTPQATDVDGAQPLDYFDDSLYDIPTCSDLASCLQAAFEHARDKQVISGATD